MHRRIAPSPPPPPPQRNKPHTVVSNAPNGSFESPATSTASTAPLDSAAGVESSSYSVCSSMTKDDW